MVPDDPDWLTPDSCFIDKSLRGDSTAFTVIVRRYQERLYDAVLPLVHDNKEAALDIVQETFLDAYKTLDKLRGDVKIFIWLYCNACLLASRITATRFMK
jgi:RNA polymerase sigma-70 factor (ECF subfamily)